MEKWPKYHNLLRLYLVITLKWIDSIRLGASEDLVS